MSKAKIRDRLRQQVQPVVVLDRVFTRDLDNDAQAQAHRYVRRDVMEAVSPVWLAVDEVNSPAEMMLSMNQK